MASKTIKEINARNDKRAKYLARQMDRLLSNPDGPPIEITPEIERALNTPVSQLPIDFTVRGAISSS